MAQNGGRRKGGRAKGAVLTDSQRKLKGKKSSTRISQKLARARRGGLVVKRMLDEMCKRKQFVDFSDDPRARYGAREFNKNMLNGALLNASSTSCAELSKIKAIEEGGKSSGCEWQRRKINSADNPCTMRVFEEEARRVIEQLERGGRLPDTPQLCSRPAH